MKHNLWFEEITRKVTDLVRSEWLRQLRRRIDRTPKNCILCEDWVWFRAPVCRPCRKYLYSEYLRTEYKILNIDDLPCYYVWDWNSNNHEWIQKVIVAMKDGNNFELYKLFVTWLLRKVDNKSPNLVVAVPSFDRLHPQALVEAFKCSNPGILEIALTKKISTSQKIKSKGERGQTHFSYKDLTLRRNIHQAEVWVLDDVIATGESFRGVVTLLKGHKIKGALVWAYKS